MVSFRQTKSGLEKLPEEKQAIKDVRFAPGASATGSNVGPERLPGVDPEYYEPQL